MAGLRWGAGLVGVVLLLAFATLEWRSQASPFGRKGPTALTYSEWSRIARNDGASAQWLASYCVEKQISCIIDMTAEPISCGFDESSTAEMARSTIERARAIAEERCPGYRWRETGLSLVFEPKDAPRGTLERMMPAYDSESPVPAAWVLLDIARLGHLENTTTNAGEGHKPRDSAPAHVHFPAGSVKDALEAAARKFPETVWWVTLNKYGHIYGTSQWYPPAAKEQRPAR